MINVRNILVPVDFSENSGKAILYAAEIAGALNSRLHFLHVINQQIIETTQELCIKGYKGDFIEILRDMVRERKKDLIEYVSESMRNGIDVEFAISKGKPANEIINFAKNRNIDLIIVGTIGRSAVGAVLAGSVAQNLVNHSPCPVLVVRPDEHLIKDEADHTR